MSISAQGFKEFKTISELHAYLKHGTLNETKQWIRDNVPLESYYQKSILTFLKRNYPCYGFAWKESQGTYTSANGIPDISFVYKGQFFGFEVKRPFIGKLSNIQKTTIEALRQAGAVVAVVTYIDDVAEILNHYK
jgi:hypothetical protein